MSECAVPSWLCVPGDVEEQQTLQLHVLDFGCQVRPVTLREETQTGSGLHT